MAQHHEKLHKTEMCKFFSQHRCRNGSQCSFAHSHSEIRSKPEKVSSVIFAGILQVGLVEEPRTDGIFKSKMCQFEARGLCKYGNSCRFAHSEDELGSTSDTTASQPADVETCRRDGALSLGPMQRQSSSSTDASYNADCERESESSEESDDWETDSDGSTKASTMDEVDTPEGSVSDDADCQQRRRMPRTRNITTMILKNVPECLTQGALLSQFEDLSPCMRATFDFFYLPWNPRQGRNLGFAIVNFFDAETAKTFKSEWHNEDLLKGFGDHRGLHILPAIIQGFEANIRHFSGFSLAHHANLRFRPLLRQSPQMPLRAMAVSAEQIEQFETALAQQTSGLPIC